VRNFTDLIVLRISRQEARGERREAASSDEHSTATGKVCQLLQSLPRYALNAGQDNDSISAWAKIKNAFACLYATDLTESIVIEKIQVESCFENLRHYVGTHQVTKSLDQMNFPGGEMRPGIAVGKIQSHVVLGLPLAKQGANSLQISRDVRHYEPPGILIVQSASRIEAPSGILDTFRSVRPTVTYQLVDSL
jgi:hypothetical protein